MMHPCFSRARGGGSRVDICGISKKLVQGMVALANARACSCAVNAMRHMNIMRDPRSIVPNALEVRHEKSDSCFCSSCGVGLCLQRAVRGRSDASSSLPSPPSSSLPCEEGKAQGSWTLGYPPCARLPLIGRRLEPAQVPLKTIRPPPEFRWRPYCLCYSSK